MEPPEPVTELSVKLGEAMVERLQPHVPDSVELSNHGTWIDLRAPNGRSEQLTFVEALDQGLGDHDHLEKAIWLILERVQSFVVEHVLRAPWPPPGSGTSDVLPTAGVNRVSNGFEVFYAPGLALPLLTDDELGLGD
jgi:hypothetical protein